MRTAFALLVFALPLVAAPVPKSVKKARPALDGTWQAVEWYDGEDKMDLDDGIIWTIEGESVGVRGRTQAVPVGFATNATRTITKAEDGGENAIDYNMTYTDGTRPSRRPAVYELNGNTLRVCMHMSDNGPRPADCKPTNGTRTYVFERADAK